MRPNTKRAAWLSLALLLLAALAHAQATLHKDLKKDFGALGDGRTNDLAAFQKAAEFFNQRAKTPAGAGRAELRIPAGTYRVGEPGPGGLPSLLALRGCRNLAVVGDDSARTIIRYADGLRYGTFDPTSHQPYDPPQALFTDWGWGVNLGTAIELQECDNVEVRGLALDGNSPHLLVGGHWGDTGIQLAADGVFVSSSRRIRLRQLAVHHFGRDGVQVLNRLAKSLDEAEEENILLENCRFDYNGRQGLSVTGVHGLRAVGCSFSHTGRVPIPALGKPLFSNPGAGVDVEPEGGYAANVRFERCRFVDNAGQGLVSDRYGDGPATTKNVLLRDCLLWGTTNWSVWLRQPGFVFENCRLYGAFEHGCRAREASWATRFVGCTFADRPYHGQPAYGPVLLDSNHEARGMRFERCRFEASHGGLFRAVPATADSVGRFWLRNCTLVLNQATLPLADNLLASAELSGTTTVLAGPQLADSVTIRFTLGAAGMPAPVLRPGACLRLLAPGVLLWLPSGLRLLPGARLEVGARTNLELTSAAAGVGPTLSLAASARLLVRPSGTAVLGAGTRTVVAGRLEVARGGRLRQLAAARIEAFGRGQVVRHDQPSR